MEVKGVMAKQNLLSIFTNSGLKQGIMDITDIVVNASKDGNSIDWKQAYLELQHITEDVKSTLPLPLQLDFESK